MRIEMGESLLYSYLRHIKKCQIVQTNWKTSPTWDITEEDKIQHLMTDIDDHFSKEYQYNIFKKNSSLQQIIQQAELDAIGVCPGKIYACEVAYHSAGLQYGPKEVTTQKVISKMARAAFVCLGYMRITEGEIIFASPKINKATLDLLLPCIDDLQIILNNNGLHLELRLMYNEEFRQEILDQVASIADKVADEAELFLRSYQLLKLFDK